MCRLPKLYGNGGKIGTDSVVAVLNITMHRFSRHFEA